MIIKPNAGLPDPKTGEYDLGAEDFGRQMVEFLKLDNHWDIGPFSEFFCQL